VASISRVGRSSGSETFSLPSLLSSIPGVESVDKLGEEDSVTAYLIRTLPHQDLRSEISKRIVESGIPLIEVVSKGLSLEDIFLKLVRSEETIELQ